VPDPCGTKSFKLKDTDTGSALDATVFSESLASAPMTLSVATNDSLKAKTFNLQVTAFYTAYETETSASKAFTVTIQTVCIPSSIAETQFSPSSLSYTLGRAAVTSTFAAWTTVPAICSLVFQMQVFKGLTKAGGSIVLADASLISLNAAARTLTVQGSSVFAGGDHVTGTYMPGTYLVEIKAYSNDLAY